MKSFECESSSEGDEPTLLPISRTVADPQPWMKGNNAPSWGWQTVSLFFNIISKEFVSICANFVVNDIIKL